MRVYTVDMFNENNIEILFKPILTEKETLEFQLKIYGDKFDSYKKANFPELVLYENKKKHNPNIIPDKLVLAQLKDIEKEPDVQVFRQKISQLTREIKTIENKITSERTKINSMFTFSDYNCEKYINELNKYYHGNCSFNSLMELIFGLEFLDKIIYYELAYMRNLDVIYLLVEKSPLNMKKTMRNIYDELVSVFKLEEFDLIEEYDLMVDGRVDIYSLSALIQKKYSPFIRSTV